MRIVSFLSALIVMAVFTSCKLKVQKSNNSIGDTRTKAIEYLDKDTYKLNNYTNDKTYGYSENNPVKVGGIKENEGPTNERRFLNALVGKNGEKVMYVRVGSCCVFDTPNGLMENKGLLDRYKVFFENRTDTIYLYLNMYDKGDLYVPVGFKAKK